MGGSEGGGEERGGACSIFLESKGLLGKRNAHT